MSCGAADTAVYLLRLPPSQGKIQALTGEHERREKRELKLELTAGHDGTVQSVDWSHSGDLLLTGSADRTAKLWTPTQKDPLLTISQSQSTSKLKSTVCSTSPSPSSSHTLLPGILGRWVWFPCRHFPRRLLLSRQVPSPLFLKLTPPLQIPHPLPANGRHQEVEK